MTRQLHVFSLLVLVISACGGDRAAAPAPEKKPVRLELHGDVRVDDYYWLRERDNPAVIAYLEAENAYTEHQLSSTEGFRKSLFDEIKGRIKEDDQSAPYRHGDYYYYYRYVTGSEYPIYARRKGSPDADEQILLDVNALASDAPYFAVRGFKVSPDHRLAAYAVDTEGRRFYDIFFLDLKSGKLLGDRIERVTPDFEWANDSRTLLYAKQDPVTLRSHRVFRHELGEASDPLVYEEADQTNYLGISKSLSGKYFYLTSSQTLSTEVRYVPADAPAEAATLFLPRETDHEYFVTDGGDRFFVVSNDGAVNFRLLEAPLDDRSRDAWREVVAHRDSVLLEDVEVFSDHLVLTVVDNGITRIEVVERASGESYRVDFGEQVYTAYLDDNYEFRTGAMRYTYESMTTPESTYDFDMSSKQHTLIREEPVLGGFDRDNYRTEQLFARARDGTPIPVSIVYRKGTEKDRRNPLLQYGYGAYGASIGPSFNPDRLTLLDRGFIYAIAHIRGGSELGRQWYYEGRQLQKKNTFHDFIDVSRYLIDEGYTSPEHLYAAGGSAGGLLMGAVLNMAPELYNGVLARVPFVDAVTTMLDEDIPLTSGEWDEWGNPADPVYYEYMKSYSPYDNVAAKAYPNILVTAGLHDSQVQYWEPAKWVAKLRDTKTDDRLLLLKTDMSAGHSGKTGRLRRIEDTALEYSFFLMLEGIRE